MGLVGFDSPILCYGIGQIHSVWLCLVVWPTRPDHGRVFLFLSTATRSPNLPNCPQGSALPDWCQGAWGTRELPRLGGSLEGMMGAPWKGIKGDFLGRGLRTAWIGWIELEKVWEDDVARVIGEISYFNYIYIIHISDACRRVSRLIHFHLSQSASGMSR